MQRGEQGLMAAPAASDQRAAYRASDAKLLDLVRAGNTTAYDILSARHVEAARRLARTMVAAAEADRVVAEAFAEVRDATLLGHGPSDAFRPYLLTVLHAIGSEPTHDPDLTDLETSPVLRAFCSLPARWIAVLWHTEIDQTSAADAARIIGVDPIGIAPLHRLALDALQRAYLQARMSEAANRQCQRVVRRLAAYLAGSATRRDQAIATRHLDRCGECRATCAQFTDIEVVLRRVVARALLGPAAASYVYAARDAAKGKAAAAHRKAGTAIAASWGAQAPAPAHTKPLRPGRQLPAAPRRLRWLGAGAVAAAAAAAALLVVPATGNSAPTPTHHARHVGSVPAPSPAITRQPAQKPAAAPPVPSPPPIGAPPAEANADLVNSPAVPRAPVPAKLSATVDVRPSRTGFTDRVVFAVADTGGNRTGELAVSLDLPGSSLELDRFGSSFEGTSNGWACQQTWAGASCQHNGIQAGSRIEDSLFISVSVPEEACGRPVMLTAVSGTVSASALSPEGIQCRRAR